MAWSRFGWGGSSIYTFPSERDGVGTLECCACPLMEDAFGSFWTVALDPFLVHLGHHRDAGHVVPDGLEEMVAAEAAEYLGPTAPAARSTDG